MTRTGALVLLSVVALLVAECAYFAYLAGQIADAIGGAW